MMIRIYDDISTALVTKSESLAGRVVEMPYVRRFGERALLRSRILDERHTPLDTASTDSLMKARRAARVFWTNRLSAPIAASGRHRAEEGVTWS